MKRIGQNTWPGPNIIATCTLPKKVRNGNNISNLDICGQRRRMWTSCMGKITRLRELHSTS